MSDAGEGIAVPPACSGDMKPGEPVTAGVPASRRPEKALYAWLARSCISTFIVLGSYAFLMSFSMVRGFISYCRYGVSTVVAISA